jgi:hypothetical protein
MSATFSKEDKGWLACYSSVKPLNPHDEAIVQTTFDNETGDDIKRIEKEMARDKLLRKTCLIKLLTFPLEYVAIFVLLGKLRAKDKINLTKIYYKFYKQQISFYDLQKDLQELSKSGKII